MIPSARLWASLCLLAIPTIAVGFIAGLWPILLALDAAFLVLAAVDFLVARSVPLKVWRALPTRLQVGVQNKIDVHLINTSRRRLRVLVRDDAPEQFDVRADVAAPELDSLLSFTLHALAAPVGLAARSTRVGALKRLSDAIVGLARSRPPEPDVLPLVLGGRTRARASYTATPKTRGRFAFGDLYVRVRGPLGLMWHERVTAAAEEVSVFPDMRGASRLLLSDAVLDFVNLGLRQLRRDGRGSEFARLRDYAQGDSAREVDWKATARRGRPVTRVMESERSQTVLIGVDCGRTMAAHVDGLTKLDHAVNASLFVAFVAVRNGDRVGLVVFADGVKTYLAPAAGRLQYRKIVDALYSAKPHLTYVDYLALFKELNQRLLKRSLLCVFTDFIDEDQAATMVGPFRRLARRHVPVCMSVKDAALARLLRHPPPDAEIAYQHAVASELLLEREALKRKIGQDGVYVVDVDAHELSLAAVNKYLEIKARGTL